MGWITGCQALQELGKSFSLHSQKKTNKQTNIITVWETRYSSTLILNTLAMLDIYSVGVPNMLTSRCLAFLLLVGHFDLVILKVAHKPKKCGHPCYSA